MTVQPFVVVVDDDRSVRQALGRLLRTAQMEVETFASAEKFLLAVLPREPECLVLDVRMPGMSGPELRDRLHTNGRRIPIVFITAHESDVGASGASDGIVAQVLYKPFNDQALLAAIARAIAAS